VGEECAKYTEISLEDIFNEHYPDVNMEEISVNDTQRIILVGFSIESSLERMINWLSNSYDVSINALVLKYAKTSSGDELLVKTSIISEEIEQQKTRKKKGFNMAMSDVSWEYEPKERKTKLTEYFSKDLWSAMRIRKVLIPVSLENGVVTKTQFKDEFMKRQLADDTRQAGILIALISSEIGKEKNDSLCQVIKYEYPNNSWEKDNYNINPEYADLLKEVVEAIED
jgi:hypothetical protein